MCVCVMWLCARARVKEAADLHLFFATVDFFLNAKFGLNQKAVCLARICGCQWELTKNQTRIKKQKQK